MENEYDHAWKLKSIYEGLCFIGRNSIKGFSILIHKYWSNS